MKTHLSLVACAILLSAGLLHAEAVRPAGPGIATVQNGSCDGNPTSTGIVCPSRQGAAMAWTWQDLQACMAGAEGTMQGYRSRYLICQARRAGADGVAQP